MRRTDSFGDPPRRRVVLFPRARLVYFGAHRAIVVLGAKRLVLRKLGQRIAVTSSPRARFVDGPVTVSAELLFAAELLVMLEPRLGLAARLWGWCGRRAPVAARGARLERVLRLA